MMVEAPADAACAHCAEPIAAGDFGVTIPYWGAESDGCQTQFVRVEAGFPELAFHRECHIRTLVGSVGHLRGKCSCEGGAQEDPPGLSKREAARAAAELFEARMRRGA